MLLNCGFFSLEEIVFIQDPLERLNNKILSVALEHHFTPAVIDALFADAVDYHGLDWWYDEIEKKSEKK